MANSKLNILQIGTGNFGKRHLQAWKQLGFIDRLWVAELDTQRWAEAKAAGVSDNHLTRSAAEVLSQVQIVDIVTPTEHHLSLCRQALEAGKDVFMEKPMTMNAAEARQVLDLCERAQRLVQVGYYYRFHPASQLLKREIASGRLGKVRYLTGNFCGFKRARNDVGVMHTDGIHFLDLFNWLLDSSPADVFAVTRDHFGRGLEDFAVAMMNYPNGAAAKVEAGYIQPGRWPDKVVAGAMTTKEITVVGDAATAEIDFETEIFTITDCKHSNVNGVWTPTIGKPVKMPVEPCDPTQMISRELDSFLQSVASRKPTAAGPFESGLQLAALMEGIYESAAKKECVRLDAGQLAGAR